ncbi:MAG: TetR family transcriptional regulator [Mesorhizobium sp.]|nr:TetR/AcrR family transcriptional regulator [Mesorhizobium sp. M2A.F.Ca.ET.015.02.1.1]RUW67457.1 TetR/AcrR family transcriptional regulator [Mesorhizobium sp. M2A.F.Ca.ET.067.02.1.1]RVC98577.1 TetR/AcrR family transcriptional regulator [Mesorhizobium sp. M2A.F.Ca.ET.029.05.1.1]RWB40226.1 MAG: TetR/AcrR family transcriptional regulator [Mesorhizobium sp.]RWB57964.1 MAG: TetR/AcrR family transcriptional regulator [Mesorhizobium sp.]
MLADTEQCSDSQIRNIVPFFKRYLVSGKRHNEVAEGVDRRVRVDVQRNLDALLQAAKAVFATSGVDAPVREIAEKAGVGVGTVYRHFPRRSDLVAAVFRREIDACAAAAPLLAASYEPGEALLKWIERYVAFIATKRGLAEALHSGDSVFEPLPLYFQQNLEPALGQLLHAAATAGEIRGDVDAGDLLNAIARLSGADQAQRMVALLVDGLRYGKKASSGVR